MIFISYSRKENDWLNLVLTHLKGAGGKKFMDNHVWYDGDIEPGANWEQRIKKMRARTTIAILLVCEKYVANDFILEEELDYFLKNNIKIYWFLVNPCICPDSLAEIQAANKLPVHGLISLQELKEKSENSKINKILSDTCKKIYQHFSNGNEPASVKEILPSSIIYKCDRRKILSFFTEHYYNNNFDDHPVWYFSIEGHHDDQLTSVHKSIQHNTLEDDQNTTFYSTEVDIQPYASNRNFLLLFQCKLVQKLKLPVVSAYIKNLTFNSLIEEFAKRPDVKQNAKGLNVILISILIRSEDFYASQYEKVLDWLFTSFPDAKNNATFKILFFLTFQYCGDQEKDNAMKKFIQEKGMIAENTLIKDNIIHLGNHEHVKPEDVRSWFAENATTDHASVNNYINSHFDENKKMRYVEETLASYVRKPF